MGEAMVFEGSTKAFVFEASVEHILAPMLKEGQIVVMDNLLSAHKTDRVRELIEEKGCELCGCYRPIFARAQPHRGSILEGQGPPRESGGTYEGGARRSDERSAFVHHAPRRCGMVRSLWLRT
jgi:hypothetical protein